MKDITKNYSNGEITIVWKPELCMHSTLCWKGEKGLLPVFNPLKKPWINPEGASSADIIGRVNNCPSGALSFYYNDSPPEETNEQTTFEQIVEAKPNGPLIVYGNITVRDQNGQTSQKNNVTAFCRCGASSNKPYCDGTHVKISFKG